MPERPRASTSLIMAVRDLVCCQADSQLHATRSETTGDWDLDNSRRPSTQRKSDYLVLLATSRAVIDALEHTIMLAHQRALSNGATFAEIGAAQGISRQAARQYYNRDLERRPVTLLGGPLDGETRSAFGRENELRFSVRNPAFERYSLDDPGESYSAVYRKKYGSPDVFEFHRFVDDRGKPVAHVDQRPRVHEIARAWRLEAHSVLAQAKKIDTRIRSTSSRVDLTTVERMYETLLSAEQ